MPDALVYCTGRFHFRTLSAIDSTELLDAQKLNQIKTLSEITRAECDYLLFSDGDHSHLSIVKTFARYGQAHNNEIPIRHSA